MNIEKTIIEGDLWYIDNFLTQEEVDWFKPYMDEKTGWYTTMRSPYKNILNKFPFTDIPLYDDGTVRLPRPEDTYFKTDMFHGPGGISDRIIQVMPPVIVPHGALQSFKYCTDEEIKKDLKDELKNDWFDKEIDFAMPFHSEWGDDSTIPQFNLSFSIYLNDDFEGGVLDFAYKPYKIKPKVGTMIGIPVTKEFTHRVTKITSGNWRHTLYGNSFNTRESIPWSTEQDC
jgi:hypothetical protein